MDSMVVDSLVNQVDWPHVKVGQNVEVTLAAAPNRTFTGEVIYVGGLANDRYLALGGDVTGVMTFRVTVLIREASPLLRPTYTAHLNIITGRHQDVCYVPWTAVSMDDEGAAHVRVVDSHGQHVRSVELGAGDAVHVIVTKGLEAGEFVLCPTRN